MAFTIGPFKSVCTRRGVGISRYAEYLNHRFWPCGAAPGPTTNRAWGLRNNAACCRGDYEAELAYFQFLQRAISGDRMCVCSWLVFYRHVLYIQSISN